MDSEHEFRFGFELEFEFGFVFKFEFELRFEFEFDSYNPLGRPPGATQERPGKGPLAGVSQFTPRSSRIGG